MLTGDATKMELRRLNWLKASECDEWMKSMTSHLPGARDGLPIVLAVKSDFSRYE